MPGARCPHTRKHGQRKVRQKARISKARTTYSFVAREQAEPLHHLLDTHPLVGHQRRARGMDEWRNRDTATQTQTTLGMPNGYRHRRSIEITINDCIVVVCTRRHNRLPHNSPHPCPFHVSQDHEEADKRGT